MHPRVALYTIGFAQTSAEEFFAKLNAAAVRSLIDIRLRPSGQLSGYAKMPDLAFFLERLAGVTYRYAATFAPTADLLDRYRGRHVDADAFAAEYRALLDERRPEREFVPADFDHAVLLCSERDAAHCHRRVAAAYIRDACAGVAEVAILDL